MMKKCKCFFKARTPYQLISLAFAAVILVGTILLLLPVSAREGIRISFIDALFTATSAVCVTGLLVMDTADSFSVFGMSVVGLLIQIGGLGVTSVGIGVILAAGGRVSFKGRLLVREALNMDTSKGLVRLVERTLLMTLCFEGVGTLLSFFVFVQDYAPLDALGISLFHSVAAFNNAGFDILGGMRNLIPYQDNVMLNLVTAGLIIFGGLGFLVILDLIKCRSFKKLTLHSKAVLVTNTVLLALGTIFLKGSENISWLGAFFQSVSARTAGFSTYAIGDFTDAGLFCMMILMFIGASPGSTGGGIKTSTIFVLLHKAKSVATNQHCSAFRRKIPKDVIDKAFVVFFLSLSVVCAGTLLLCVLEPEYSFIQLMFEIVSAFGTVGLSTGITPSLGLAAKLLIVAFMFTGRLGALTIVSIWLYKEPAKAVYSEEGIAIG